MRNKTISRFGEINKFKCKVLAKIVDLGTKIVDLGIN